MTASITIIATARERYSLTQMSLESLYATTRGIDFDLVYVDVKSPPPVRRFLERESRSRGFELVRVDEYVCPNRARNIGIERAAGEYLVFVDNDVIFGEEWLTRLVQCCDETGAWAVGPLYLHGPFEDGIVHMAGGTMAFSGSDGEREFVQVQKHFNEPLSTVPPESMVRAPSDIIEFHCALVRKRAFEEVGLLDEQLMTTREHLDLCLRVFEAGGTVWYEPSAVISYLVPPPFLPSDLPYFLLRWSDRWTETTLRHFADKYGIVPEYVDRVEKTRQRRQKLLFAEPLRSIEHYSGRHVADAAGRVASAVEPVVNRVIVRLLDGGRRPLVGAVRSPGQ